MSYSLFSDEHFMHEALKMAQIAFEQDEIPVGALVVLDNKIIGKGYNLTEKLNDVTAHAEMQAITSAASFLGAKYLTQCTLYVTLEPCIMCAGAIAWSQIPNVVYGASDSKKGFSSFSPNVLHPKTVCKSDILAHDCSQLLKTFFQIKRQ